MINVEIADRQSTYTIDTSKLIDVSRSVLTGEDFQRGELSIAVVDTPTMHELNRQYLDHDYTTDVLSFPLGGDDETIEGELIICADVAAEVAQRHDWSTMDELLLYTIHGSLHLAGYDDKSDDARAEMRERETHYLKMHSIRASNDEEVTLLRATKDSAP